MNFLRTMPVLQVADVVASARFYERLGFRNHGFWGEPPAFCIVQRDGVTIALDRGRDGSVPVNQWWAAYIYVENVEALHREWSTLDLPEITKPEDREYGLRDFDIVDSDGHRIAFGQDLLPTETPGHV